MVEIGEHNQAEAKKCRVCLREVEFSPQYGPIHKGGGIYVQKCLDDSCGWFGTKMGSYKECPKCSGQLIDDHAVRY